jgi:hypothetical protein
MRQSIFADACLPASGVDRHQRFMSAFITPMALHTELVAPADAMCGARAAIARRTTCAMGGQNCALSDAARVRRATLAARAKLALEQFNKTEVSCRSFASESPERSGKDFSSSDDTSNTSSEQISAFGSDDFPLPMRASGQLLEMQKSNTDVHLPAQQVRSISQLELHLGRVQGSDYHTRTADLPAEQQRSQSSLQQSSWIGEPS